MSDEMPPPASDTFKAPLAVSKPKGDDVKPDEGPPESGEPKEPSASGQDEAKRSVSEKPVALQPMKYPPQKCPYDEPAWSGVPQAKYELTVIKDGSMVSTLPLDKSFITVGRHQDCDITLDNPSISRFHAVLQYRKLPEDADPEKKQKLEGFYLYDLGSTHGTQLNRQPMDPKSYKRVRVGHHLKFGFSTRTFILDGPPEDSEEEDTMTVTEIVQHRKQRELEWKLRKQEAEKPEEERKKATSEDNGISWGMGDDAEETEEAISEVNPFSLNETNNEQLYLDDPKRTLRGWFEREGYELEYKVEDKGLGTFLCRIELPVDTGSGSAVIAEASVKGKKKEAVIQCALEACRILDRHGELRKSQHESRKRKLRNWKDDDYLDSDEDDFLDRTGELEAKKEKRKQRLERTEVVETYDTLKEKLEAITKKIEGINKALEQSKLIEDANKSGAGGDSLDSFMKQLKSGTALDKAKRSQMRLELARLMPERLRIIKMVNIAKPTELPALKMQPMVQGTSGAKLMPMIGSVRGRKMNLVPTVSLPVSTPIVSSVTSDAEPSEEVEMEEEEKPAEDSQEEEEKAEETMETESTEKDSGDVDVEPVVQEKKTEKLEEPKKGANSGPVKFQQINRPKKPSMKTETKKPSTKARIQPTLDAATSDAILKTSGDFEDWVPPKNQSGDGKTHLNDKFGY